MEEAVITKNNNCWWEDEEARRGWNGGESEKKWRKTAGLEELLHVRGGWN